MRKKLPISKPGQPLGYLYLITLLAGDRRSTDQKRWAPVA